MSQERVLDPSTLHAYQKQYHTQKRLADALFGLFRTLGSELHVERVANIGLLTLTGQLLIKCASFFERDGAGNYRLLATVGVRDSTLDGLEFPDTLPLLVGLFSNGTILELPESSVSEHASIARLREHGFHSLFPLADGPDPLGIIALGDKIVPGSLTPEDLQLLDAFGVVIAVSLKNSLAFQLVESSRNELSRLNEMKREFLSHVSHEFRTPLTILKNTIEMIDADPEIREMQVSALARFEYLINSVLLLNEINSRGVVLDRQHVNVRTWVAESIQPLLERQGTFAMHLDVPDCTLEFDPFKIRTATESLVDNAVKFGADRKSGDLSLYLSTRDVVLEAAGKPIDTPEELNIHLLKPKQPVDPAAPDAYLVVEVKDRGIGIPAHELDVIFQPFSQAANSPTRGVKGAGLGLTMCRRIVDAHGGQVLCRSAMDRGTVFCIAIPVGRDQG